jgi:hypothetical protein
VQDGGWIAGDVPPTTAMTPFRRFLGRLMPGIPAAAVGSLVAVNVVALAWEACWDTDAGDTFGLGVFWLPATAIVMWFTWVLAVGLTWRAGPWKSLIVGLAALVLVGYGVLALNVGRTESFADPYLMVGDTCQPDGTPTWWPAWLPI